MVVVALMGLLAALLPNAEAFASTRPVTGSFPLDEHFIDDGASASCGFPVMVDLTGNGRFEVLFDRQGAPTRIQVETGDSGTFSGNGHVVGQAAHAVQIFDLTSGTETDLGLVIRVFGSHGTITSDVGRLVFDGGGTLSFEAGPHPSLHGDFAALCAALGA
jgi:hypothetical protein